MNGWEKEIAPDEINGESQVRHGKRRRNAVDRLSQAYLSLSRSN